MKAIKYLAAVIILALSTQFGFAENDGTSIDKSPVKTTFEVKVLFPVIPAIADFSEAEIERIADLIADLATRFAPENPQEATFIDTDLESDIIFLLKPSKKFAPEYPQEADFDDQPTENELFSPKIPSLAPYSEAL